MQIIFLSRYKLFCLLNIAISRFSLIKLKGLKENIAYSILYNYMKTIIYFTVTVKPLVVQILTKEARVSADKNYDVECRTSGSRPEAVITWWKANKPIKKMAQAVSLIYFAYVNYFMCDKIATKNGNSDHSKK